MRIDLFSDVKLLRRPFSIIVNKSAPIGCPEFGGPVGRFQECAIGFNPYTRRALIERRSYFRGLLAQIVLGILPDLRTMATVAVWHVNT